MHPSTIFAVGLCLLFAYLTWSGVGGSYPGGSNTYIPSFDTAGRLIVAYLRDPATFPLARYLQIIPVKRDTGYYLNLTPQEAARIGDINDDVWNYGDESPEDNDALAPFNFLPFKTQRRRSGFNIPFEVEDQADWDVKQSHADNEMNRLKTKQAVRAQATLAATAWGNNTATATSLGGGKWDVGTSTAPYIKQSLNQAAIKIHLATLGAVSYADLNLVVNPNLAALMAKSQEIHDYMKGSPAAQAELESSQNGNRAYGLPSTLYGMPFVVEDTVKISARTGATMTPAFVMADAAAYVLARKGGIEGRYGSPSFTTLARFAYEELSVEIFEDRENRRHKHKLTTNDFEATIAPASGFAVTACSG